MEAYIKRVDEILKNKNDQKSHHELSIMIQYIEGALDVIKEKYNGFAPNKKTEPVYNAETNQYEITIQNLKLRGNIGNIYDKKLLLNDRVKAHQVVICAHKNNCYNIINEKYCKFWHDPQDLLILRNLNIISNEFYSECIKFVRNFINTSYIYNNNNINTNKNIRLIGSKSSLENDIKLVKISPDYQHSVENMKAQVMHDILILCALKNE